MIYSISSEWIHYQQENNHKYFWEVLQADTLFLTRVIYPKMYCMYKVFPMITNYI